MFKFIKSIFGSGENSDSPISQHVQTPEVPESVLDRFLLNAKELYYFAPNTKDVALKLEGKKASVSREHPHGSIAVIAIFWLRDVYKSNGSLFASITNRYKPLNDTVSDEDKRRFLWAYFRTGNSISQPQLDVFYFRGKGIIGFVDAISKNWEMLLTPSEHRIQKLTERIGSIKDLKTVDGLNDEDLTLIVEDFMNRMNKGTVSSPSAHTDKVKQDDMEEELLVPTTQIIRPQKPRQQKHKGAKSDGLDAYLLLFSASWCGPSKKFVKEIKEAGINSYTYIDVDEDWAEELASKYEVRNIPTTFLVTIDGTVIKKWVGYDDEDPGQTKFVDFINTCGYNILPFPTNREDARIGQILPEKKSSYVVGKNGEPMIVFFRQKSQLFVNRAIGDEKVGYFLNIRKPLMIDVENQDRVDIPPIPTGCDGIILKNYGLHKSTAFIVKDKSVQSMEVPLG